MVRGRFLFLGTGASAGVPLIGCRCAVCSSVSPYNQRLRPSILIDVKGKKLLIDAGPDFRTQALRAKIERVDGLLLTHIHSDHTAGLDDLRVFYFHQKAPIPCLLSTETLDELKTRFSYLFRPMEASLTVSAQFSVHVLEGERGVVDFLGIRIFYTSYSQGGVKVNGFRIGDFAYISDIKEYDKTIFTDLQGVRILVLSALRDGTSLVHFGLKEAVDFTDQVGAETCYLTHLSHDLDYEKTNEKLPPHVRLAYDGLVSDFCYEE